MKIYVNSQYSITDFIDTGLWVKAVCTDPTVRNPKRYIQVFRRGGNLRFHSIPYYYVDDLDATSDITYYPEYIAEQMSISEPFWASDFVLYTPFSAYTAEELIEILGLDPNEVHV